MAKRQITTSFNSYLPLTCLRNLRYAAVTLLLVIGVGNVWGDPTVLFHETFGNKTDKGSRVWNDNYSVKSGVTAVYSDVEYTVSANQAYNSNGYGSNSSPLAQTGNNVEASFVFGPLHVSSYESLVLTYYWKAGSVNNNTKSTSVFYKTSSNGDWTSVSKTSGSAATTYNLQTFNLPVAAQSNTLYLKITWVTSNTIGYIDEVELTGTAPSCSNTVTPAVGTKTNVSAMTFSPTSVATCSSTASDRQVTVTITPESCYTVPSSTRLSVTGTSAEYASGPTDNEDGTYSFVYQFAKDATGTTTFAASLSAKTTYTVQYNAGSTTYTGGNAISGSHANDTKTCGTNLTLPGVVFTTTGYTQTGWSKTNGGSQYAAVGGSYTDDAAQTFYPVWTANSYTVTWMVNNITYSAGGSTSVSYGNRVSTLPTDPDPGDYCGDKFVGWTTAAEYVHGTSPLFTTASSAPTASGAQTFYAVFADYAE